MSDATNDSELVTCGSAPDLATAELWAAYLRDQGLEVVIPDATIASMAWTWQQAMGGVRLQVTRGDLETAKRLLLELQGEAVREPESAQGDDSEPERKPADEHAHRAYKAAVVATLFALIAPYALYLLVVALRRRAELSAWGRKKLVWAAVIDGVWVGLGLLVMALVALS